LRKDRLPLREDDRTAVIETSWSQFSAYAGAQVLFAAIEKAGTLDREAIRNAIATTDMQTVCGRIRVSPQGWAVDRLVLFLQWMGGERHIIYYNKPGEKYEKYIPKVAMKWQVPWSSR
jgi:branched-chain amino acid transport system substrate-binding protein